MRRRDVRARVHWARVGLICVLRGHDPVEHVITRGRLADVLSDKVPGTLEYRCRRCFQEVDRP